MAGGPRTLIGQSLGGLLATEILMSKPELFDKYIIISPSLWWDNGSMLKRDALVLKDSFHRRTDVYIGVGKEGPAPGQMPRVMEDDARALAERLKSGKCKTIKVHFDFLPDENHATVAHQAISNAFRILYPPIKPDK